jgi:predicted MFS family arabinose efflux permease
MAATTSAEDPVRPGGAGGSLRITWREWLLLAALAGIQFTHIVDFMLMMPLGPVFQKEMGLAPREFGYVVSAYTFSAGLAGLLAARFLDRFDRKSALLVLYAGFITGTFLCAAAPDYLYLLAARTATGAFGGVTAAVVLAIVGDTFADARRATAMGIIMSAFSVASIVGVPAGLFLAEAFDWHIAFITLGGLSGGVLVLAGLVLPSLRGHMRGRHMPHISTWRVLAHANHLRAFALTAALIVSSFLLAPYLAIYLVRNVGVQQSDLKYLYFWGGAATVVTLTVIGRLADRLGKLRVFRILGLLTMVPALVMTNLPHGLSLWLVFLVTTLFMIMSSGRMVPAMALITGSSAPVYRGSFMSLNAAVQHLSAGLAAAGGGLLLQAFGGDVPVGEAAELVDQGAPLVGFHVLGVLAAAAMVLSVVLAGRIRLAAGGALAPDSLADAVPVRSHAIAGHDAKVVPDEGPALNSAENQAC